jgi:hypothetical protein
MITRREFVGGVAMTAAGWTVRTAAAKKVKAGEPGGPLPALPDGAFTVAVIPDSQQYRGLNTKAEPDSKDPLTNVVFDTQTKWLAEHVADQKIVFVSHVGDIVDRNKPDQWALAQKCMDTLHGKVPYGISVGNHDMINKTGDASLFQAHFPASRFSGMNWYGGNLDNNVCSFQTFEAQGLECLWIHLPCNAPDRMLHWADEVMDGHPRKLCFVTTHMYLGPLEKPEDEDAFFTGPKGVMRWSKCYGKEGNAAVATWEKCFSRHANLVAVCCGDQSRSQAMHMSQTGAAGNTVHSMLSDYGPGELRLLRFNPAIGRIDVVTCNPLTQSLCKSTRVVKDEREHQYSLDVQFKRG